MLEVFEVFHRYYPKSKLFLVGIGPLEEDVRKRVEDKGLRNDVIFYGASDEVDVLYQAMDAIVFPSLYEGVGMVVVEAQIAGIPCLVSKKIPEEAKFSDYMKFVGLEEGENVWAMAFNDILKSGSQQRRCNLFDVRKSGFDIREEAKKLENKYMKMFKEEKREKQ